MILEAAILNVRAGQERAFEAASPIIAATQGYISHQLRRCTETSGRYLLLVQWQNAGISHGELSRLGELCRVEEAIAPLLRSVSGCGALRSGAELPACCITNHLPPCILMG